MHVLEFSGLELDLLASGNSDIPWVMGAIISSPKWRLLEAIHVGQTLEAME